MKYIIKDNGAYHLIQASGFIPKYEEVYECPDSIDSAQDVDIVDGVVVLNEEKKSTRLAAENLESEAQAKLSYGLAAQSFGALFLAEVLALNEDKRAADIMSDEQFAALLADTTIEKIERAMWNGSIKTAKALIQTLDETYYTAEEKAVFIAKINTFLAAHGRL